MNVAGARPGRLAEAPGVWAVVAEVEADLGESGRVLLRPSGTEPLVRVMVEASTADQAAGAARRLCAAVEDALGAAARSGDRWARGPPPGSLGAMCGIIGATGADDALPILLEGLHRLEYRGYDSAGVALVTEGGLWRARRADGTHSVAELCEIAAQAPPGRHTGIGHTRWATHGHPTEANAHPHTDCTGSVALVHNGIIENHSELAAELVGRGHAWSPTPTPRSWPTWSKRAWPPGAPWPTPCGPPWPGCGARSRWPSSTPTTPSSSWPPAARPPWSSA